MDAEEVGVDAPSTSGGAVGGEDVESLRLLWKGTGSGEEEEEERGEEEESATTTPPVREGGGAVGRRGAAKSSVTPNGRVM